VAALAGDEVTIARVEGRQFLGIGWVSHVLQRTVAAMLSDAETSKRLALAEATYGHRRGALVEALAGHGIPAWGRSGHNVWVPVTEEATVVAGMLAAGYAVAAGERFRLASPPGIRITIATLRPEEAPSVAEAMAQALRGERRMFSA